jgi:hypothetical protein
MSRAMRLECSDGRRVRPHKRLNSARTARPLSALAGPKARAAPSTKLTRRSPPPCECGTLRRLPGLCVDRLSTVGRYVCASPGTSALLPPAQSTPLAIDITGLTVTGCNREQRPSKQALRVEGSLSGVWRL